LPSAGGPGELRLYFYPKGTSAKKRVKGDKELTITGQINQEDQNGEGDL